MVRHSSPPWKNRSTSPPNTNPTYFMRDMPVPYGCTDQCVTWKLAFTTEMSFSLVVCYAIDTMFPHQFESSNTAPHCLSPTTHQIALRCHRHQNQVIADAHFFTLRPLFVGRMDCPPARLTLAVLLQTNVERQLVVGRRRRQACQILTWHRWRNSF